MISVSTFYLDLKKSLVAVLLMWGIAYTILYTLGKYYKTIILQSVYLSS